MFLDNTTFVGIDPTAGQKPFAYAALDNDQHLLALGQGRLDDVLAFAAGQRQAVAAVCAPRRPNQGVLTRPEVRQSLNPQPRPGRWTDFRLADYLLRQHNISIPQTFSEEAGCPAWMQMGFRLHRRLEELGYRPFPPLEGGDPSAQPPARQCMEVYPHACYTALLGRLPFSKYTLEGRVQRQLALFEQKLRVPDPMDFFEEITRHKLMRGILPTENLYTSGELDALVAAYTAWLAVNHPEQTCALGDPQEGQIVLPVSELQSRYG